MICVRSPSSSHIASISKVWQWNHGVLSISYTMALRCTLPLHPTSGLVHKKSTGPHIALHHNIFKNLSVPSTCNVHAWANSPLTMLSCISLPFSNRNWAILTWPWCIANKSGVLPSCKWNESYNGNWRRLTYLLIVQHELGCMYRQDFKAIVWKDTVIENLIEQKNSLVYAAYNTKSQFIKSNLSTNVCCACALSESWEVIKSIKQTADMVG